MTTPENADYWTKNAFCTDYKVYTGPWSEITSTQRMDIIAALAALGSMNVNDPCNVATLCATWGFLVIPPPGFPELKISFYPHVASNNLNGILMQIYQIIATNAR
ncbi:hypothetical protein TI04_08800 [Achromatium sp. WMS2]|nr:hypothetical protein TI04_08800 [Achromatium sp. WMS2]